MKKIKILIVALSLCFSITAWAIPNYSYAKDDKPCTSILFPNKACGDITKEDVENLIYRLLHMLFSGLSIIGTIGVMVAGATYVIARDDEAKCKAAKNRLTNIIIGVIAIGLLWVSLELFIPADVKTLRDKIENPPTIMEGKNEEAAK